ncbi:MAG: hypothetical protein KC635_04415, partial [Myxococcales bacterium]|nr:hypothetical protein [Myxococcales bacterium]
MSRLLSLSAAVLALAAGLTESAPAQARSRHYDVWNFGTHCRLEWNADGTDFTFTTDPSIATGEGCASFSDPETGQLLIYTDGTTVWNGAGQAVISNLPGNSSSLHSGVIVPVPGTPGQVYVFGHSASATAVVQYQRFAVSPSAVTTVGSIGTVTLEGGATSGREGMLVIQHQNKVDWWLVVNGDTKIFVIPITAAGVGAPAATSSGVSVWTSGWSVFSASHQGDRIIVSGNSSAATGDVSGDMRSFDFDPATGALSNGTLLNASFRHPQYYGGVFSPSGLRFYFSTLTDSDGSGRFWQLDLETGDFTELGSDSVLYTFGDARLAPDGRIFVAGSGGSTHANQALHVVTSPDLAGLDCGFIHDAYPEPQGCQMELGLPQSPSALARVNLNLAVTINAPGTELVTSAVTPAGSAQAPDGAVVNVSVGGPDGYSASCTATVAGAAWACPAAVTGLVLGGAYTFTATLTYPEEEPVTDEVVATVVVCSDTATSGVDAGCSAGQPACVDGPSGRLCTNSVGCSDGTREGYTSLGTYPAIASCGGAWSVGGMFHDEPACDRQGGNDGENAAGTGCNVQDLCAEGWHVCYGPADVRSRVGDAGCADAVAATYPNTGTGPLNGVTVPPGGAFFATATAGPGNGICDDFVNGVATQFNDVFGCGNLGGKPTGATCAPFNRFSNNNCASLQNQPYVTPGVDHPATDYGYEDATQWAWTCSGATVESQNIVKTMPGVQGGVICCKDADPSLPEICDGVD